MFRLLTQSLEIDILAPGVSVRCAKAKEDNNAAYGHLDGTSLCGFSKNFS
jgi:hypothetical protein